MAEYIEREAVRTAIRNYFKKAVEAIPTKQTEDGEALDIALVDPLLKHNKELNDAIKKLPAADVRPVARGEWIKKPFEKDDWFSSLLNLKEIMCCSICGFGYIHIMDVSYNFCPNCGADMRSEN